MSEIVLTRIDDRLIHGQVMTAWVKTTKANRIVIVDNPTAEDQFMIDVLQMLAPPGISVDVYTAATAAKELGNFGPNDKIIILAKNPKILQELREYGVLLSHINVGGMGSNPNRSKLYRNISASSDELLCFKSLINQGVKVEIQIVPDEKCIQMQKLID